MLTLLFLMLQAGGDLSLVPRDFDCTVTTQGALAASEAPKRVTLTIGSEEPSQLVRFDGEFTYPVRGWVLDGTTDEFSAGNGVEGITFSLQASGIYHVTWVGCDRELGLDGTEMLTHCGFHTGGEGTCVARSEQSSAGAN